MNKIINYVLGVLIASALLTAAASVVKVNEQEGQIAQINKKLSRVLCKMGEDTECDSLTRIIK